MKMPEKHDLLAAIRGKGTRHRAILAFAMWRTFAWQDNGGVYKTVIDFNDGPLSPSSFVTSLAGLSSNLAYITSVFIGYIGTDSIIHALSNASLLKKPE